ENDPPILLAEVGPTTADEVSVRAQLVALHTRILGEALADDAPGIDATLALWQATFDRSGDTETAWKVVVAALLRDPRMMFY
ncbi:MAG: hypothetical protein ACI9K2_003950, partial [Myxococcota bacterium]